MRRSRLLLCFLLGIAIAFYAVPYLQFQGDVGQSVFSIAWMLFALTAISGNMIALLYGKKVTKTRTRRIKLPVQKKQKVRQYS